METPQYVTREEWLMAATAALAPQFTALDKPLPEKIKVSCGWPSAKAMGGANRRIGEAWAPVASDGGTWEVFISPVLADPKVVLSTLVHELCHCAAGLECGHKGEFKRLATAMGLEGKMTNTHASLALEMQFAELLPTLGAYPHAKLDGTNGRKKQTTRMIKCECPECGYVVRTTRKWLDEAGAPHCAELSHGRMLAAGSEEDQEEGE